MEPTAPFQSFADAYVAAMRGQLRDHVRCAAAVRQLVGFFGNRSVAGIARRDVGDYVVKRRQSGVCNRTINRELFVLSAAYKYAGRYWGWEVPFPGRDFKQPEPEGRLRYLQSDEAQQLYSTAALGPEFLADFIRLALHTGCRKSEMLTLTWQSVDLTAKRFTVESHLSKTGRRRVIPLNRHALDALASRQQFREGLALPSPWVFCYRDGRRVKNLYYGFRRAIREAGIEDFRVHDLRHTFASWLVGRGIPLTEIRDLLGHSSIEQTERYAHLAPDRLREAVAVLDSLE